MVGKDVKKTESLKRNLIIISAIPKSPNRGHLFANVVIKLLEPGTRLRKRYFLGLFSDCSTVSSGTILQTANNIHEKKNSVRNSTVS